MKNLKQIKEDSSEDGVTILYTIVGLVKKKVSFEKKFNEVRKKSS